MTTEQANFLSTLSDDVRMRWESNCAGEIFLVSDSDVEGLRIGHFQGDAALAAYIVSMHNAALETAIELEQVGEIETIEGLPEGKRVEVWVDLPVGTRLYACPRREHAITALLAHRRIEKQHRQ